MQVIDYLIAFCETSFEEDANKLRISALENLKTNFGIGYRVYPEDDMVLLDYNQIDSPKTHPFVIECRSLILKYSDFSVLSRKFDRFFNAGEALEYYSDFDLSRSIVQEKADGSLIGVYYNPHTKNWEISTRGMAKAEGDHVMGGTFRSHVLQALGFERETPFQTELQFQLACDQFLVHGLTYVMEFISPFNRIVTRYKHPECVLLAIMNNDGKVEEQAHLELFENFNIRLPKIYPIKDTLEELIKDANALQDLAEGFVVFDRVSNKRMKIKGADYLFAHKLRGNDPIPSQKNLYLMVFDRDPDEFLVYFPEFTDLVKEARAKVVALKTYLQVAYEQYKDIVDQKEFALKVKDIHGSGFLFKARKNGTTVEHEFDVAPSNMKLNLF